MEIDEEGYFANTVGSSNMLEYTIAHFSLFLLLLAPLTESPFQLS